MASIVLSAVGSAVGGSIGGPVGAFIGAQIGRGIGNAIDNSVVGSSRKFHSDGPRLADLAVQTSTYSSMIPILYGRARVAGNVIWARPIKEIATTSTTTSRTGGKGGGGKVTQSNTTYSYYATLAIAVCEGEITRVERVWADALQLDLSQGTYRIYKGTETQLPDSLIESFEGVGNTPAYRGMAYVVIEDFPLEAFGNRIPNFTFEVYRKVGWPDWDGQSVEEMVKSVIMIPGSGEFVYDTQAQTKVQGQEIGGQWVQRGYKESINLHTPHGKANALVALDQLEETLPNVEWVGVVVNWFGDSLSAGSCVIKPGVEYQSTATTEPEVWSVGSFSRSTAKLITYVSDSPRYGGTPDDQSLLRFLDELKARGYKIFFLPMFLMDVENKPWRGRVTGSTTDVANFFTKTNGYNAFINHYANLVVGKVDAFAIGSELIGLTKVQNGSGSFPAVSALVSLAATVKSTLGSGVKITYAADWSEYHHTDGGWYNLDPLWASSNIDVIGIDAYFPLTEDEPQSALGYDVQKVIDGWGQGEGYSYYYSDTGRTTQASLSAPYAWKNISWWWNNTHTNPNGSTTAWTPNSKPIWFTEYGFPSVDGATNQPNVFVDPTSSESFYPRGSLQRVDFRAQRMGIAGTEAKWGDNALIQRRFLWTWDARPFPYWPDLRSVWADGGNWKTGHWVQGKLGISALAGIVANVCQRAGLGLNKLDVSRLTEAVEGYVVTRQSTARTLIEQLMQGYFFDTVESDGQVKCLPRGTENVASIEEAKLIPDAQGENATSLKVTRAQELELPQRVEIAYLNRLTNYQVGTQASQRLTANAQDVASVALPIVLGDQQAKQVADVALFNQWMSRTRYQCDVPMAYAALEPGDVIAVTSGNTTHTLRIVETHAGRPGMIRITGVAEDAATYDFYTPAGEAPATQTQTDNVAPTRLEFVDMPAMPQDGAGEAALRFAAVGTATNWRGAALYSSQDGGGSYQQLTGFDAASVLGTATNALGNAAAAVFDEVNTLTVVLVGDGELSSVSELAVLNGANVALVGDEVIQFQNAVEVEAGKYTLSRLLRGRLGTEWAMSAHTAGERFVLLDGRVKKESLSQNLIGLSRLYKPVSVGASLGSVAATSFTYGGRALKPYAPVQVNGARDGSGNLTMSWIRRTRVGGEWRDYVDAALSETTEMYEVDILNGANVVRTISATTTTASYAASQQVTDFGSAQSAISVKVYQISSQIGRGYPATTTV